MKTFARCFFAVLVVAAVTACESIAANIVTVEGEKPAAVRMADLVRITGMGIAGAQIAAKVDGAGKLEGSNNVRRIKNGQPVLGNTIKEFIIKPTMKGKIAVKVTIKNPTATEPIEQNYEINVE